MLTVYHGSAHRVKKPLALVGHPNLDFGQGFYLTDIRSQAENWGRRIGERQGLSSILNIYALDIDLALKKYRYLKFEEYDKQWLDFIVASRIGNQPWKKYDWIEGGIANDRVIDTIEAYMIGNITIDMALGQLASHRPNNQICLLNQQLIDECLHFITAEFIK